MTGLLIHASKVRANHFANLPALELGKVGVSRDEMKAILTRSQQLTAYLVPPIGSV